MGGGVGAGGGSDLGRPKAPEVSERKCEDLDRLPSFDCRNGDRILTVGSYVGVGAFGNKMVSVAEIGGALDVEFERVSFGAVGAPTEGRGREPVSAARCVPVSDVDGGAPGAARYDPLSAALWELVSAVEAVASRGGTRCEPVSA